MMKNSKHPITFGILIALTFFNSSEAWSFGANKLDPRPISGPSLAPSTTSSPNPKITAPNIRRGDSMSQANMQATCTNNKLNASDFSRPDSYQSYLQLCNSDSMTSPGLNRNMGATISSKALPTSLNRGNATMTNRAVALPAQRVQAVGQAHLGSTNNPPVFRANANSQSTLSIRNSAQGPIIGRANPKISARINANQARGIASLSDNEIVRDANSRVSISNSVPSNNLRKLDAGTKAIHSTVQIGPNKKQLARSLSKGMEAVPGKIEVASLDKGKLKRKIAKKESIENEEGSLAINESGRKIANENEIAEKLIALPSSTLINGVVATNAVAKIDVAELTCSNLRTLGELQRKLNEWSIQDINFFFTNGDQSFSTCCNIIRNALAPTKPSSSIAATNDDGRKADPLTEGQDSSSSEELNAPIFLLSPELYDRVANKKMSKLATNLSLVDDVKSYIDRIHSSIAVYNSLSFSTTANVTNCS